jgi:tetratricopeptide (TPR) repeat protein
MGEIFPKRINVAVDGDFMHFEVTSKWVNLSARYIFAVASAIAGNLEAAQEMMLGVESDLKRADSSARFLQPLNKHVPAQILGILDARRHDLALKHYLKRDDRFVRMNEPIVDEILKRDSANYSAKTTKAIAHFLLRRDVRSARQVLNSCKSEDDATYMYGLAFLAAYEQKFVEAEKCYFKAFRLPHRSATVAVETEEFIVDIICKEPQREYLYFGTGLINHYVKKDYGAAARDYDKFMSCGLGEEHASFIARFKKKHLVDLEHKKNG